MHAVIELPTFLNDCSGISDEERLATVTAYAVSPQQGELMPGTGGARKCRFAGRGKGKRGGYRVVSYYAADDVPVLLLALIDRAAKRTFRKLSKTHCVDCCQASPKDTAPVRDDECRNLRGKRGHE
jgi:hypothetical protein